MEHYLGIDGGGTKTKCVLVDGEMNILSEGIGGPSNFLVFGLDEVTNSLLELVTEVAQKANINLIDVKTILLGTAGAGRPDDAKRLEKSFLKEAKRTKILINQFRVESDARIALEGAFSGKPGSILIAGTGSIMFGKDSEGKIYRVGGFGRILGDEGSGFHIGRSGLTAVAKQYDGRGNETLLTKMLVDNFNISNSQELITAVYKNNIDIAAITPFVIHAADKGDAKCKEILDTEVDELLKHIHSMKNLLKEKELKISLIGGVITTDNYFSKLFIQKINSIESVKITQPEKEPAIGAALLAKNSTS